MGMAEATYTDTSNQEIPKDYQYIDWEHLERHVGKAVIGNHVPMMTEKVARYFRAQARDLRRAADKLDAAAKAMEGSK